MSVIRLRLPAGGVRAWVDVRRHGVTVLARIAALGRGALRILGIS